MTPEQARADYDALLEHYRSNHPIIGVLALHYPCMINEKVMCAQCLDDWKCATYRMMQTMAGEAEWTSD